MENKIKEKNIEFQEALALCNHKKTLEIRDEYLNLTQSKSQIQHTYIREFLYLLEESNDLELLIKYYKNDKLSPNQKYLLSNKIAKLLVPIDYKKAIEFSKENEIKYLVAKELVKNDFTKSQSFINEINEISFHYGFIAFSLLIKSNKKDLENLIEDLDAKREKNKINESDYEESLLKISFEVFETFPEISQAILNEFQNKDSVPSDILDLQILITIKKAKEDFKNITQFINDMDNLDFIKAKAILEIVRYYKNDISEIIDFIFISIDKFHSDFAKYDVIYNIQKLTNQDYSKELSKLARKLNLDDETMSFDNEIWFEYLEKNKCRFV